MLHALEGALRIFETWSANPIVTEIRVAHDPPLQRARSTSPVLFQQ
jgi:hypothetical protein